MTARDQKLRAMLEDLRDRIVDGRRSRVRGLHEKGAGEAGSVADSLDRAEADLVDDVEAALLQMATETLAKIDEALARLDAGTYGICVNCGEPIQLARLNALPFAARCRACEERGEARMAAPHLHGARRLRGVQRREAAEAAWGAPGV